MPLTIADLSRGEYAPGTSGKVDFHQMKAAGVVGCYFRAVDGVLTDGAFATFKQDCPGVLPWGAYGVIYPPGPGKSIRQQAQAYCTAMAGNIGQLPLCIDWEVDGVTWQMADEWLSVVENTFPGVEIINYTRAEYLRTALVGCTKIPRFKNLAVWQAQYGTTAPSALMAGFTMVMWQYIKDADASIYGVKEAKGLDLSYFYGTIDDFNTRFKIGSMPPIVTPPPVVTRSITSFTANYTTSGGAVLTINYSDGTQETKP